MLSIQRENTMRIKSRHLTFLYFPILLVSWRQNWRISKMRNFLVGGTTLWISSLLLSNMAVGVPKIAKLDGANQKFQFSKLKEIQLQMLEKQEFWSIQNRPRDGLLLSIKKKFVTFQFKVKVDMDSSNIAWNLLLNHAWMWWTITSSIIWCPFSN